MLELRVDLHRSTFGVQPLGIIADRAVDFHRGFADNCSYNSCNCYGELSALFYVCVELFANNVLNS